MKVECGNANPKGNVALTFKGGCMQKLELKDAYRCTGCGGWFHKECIFKHFELEKEHDYGRMKEKREILNRLEIELEAWMAVHEEKQRTFKTDELLNHMRKVIFEGGEK